MKPLLPLLILLVVAVVGTFSVTLFVTPSWKTYGQRCEKQGGQFIHVDHDENYCIRPGGFITIK